MKIEHVETLIETGTFPNSPTGMALKAEVYRAVKAIDWPAGSGSFTIHPQSGKKRGEGNGVGPIKTRAVVELVESGWTPEYRWPLDDRAKPGDMDAGKLLPEGLAAFEWETGNISSSHRSLNKMAMGLMQGKIVAGFLVVPTRAMYKYLTDRIGNYSELVPYLPLWKSIQVTEGLLQIVVIEHDAVDVNVPRIPKGTDGRAVV